MNLRSFSKPSALLAVLAISAGANAQSPTQAATAPASSPAQFLSSFEGYRPYTEEKTINWKEANELTGRIGGWRAYAKEAQQPSGDTAPAAVKPADPHTGQSKPPQAKP